MNKYSVDCISARLWARPESLKIGALNDFRDIAVGIGINTARSQLLEPFAQRECGKVLHAKVHQ